MSLGKVSVNIVWEMLLRGLTQASDVPDRLTRIDESASILSDISYDKTDDSLVSTSLFLVSCRVTFTSYTVSMILMWLICDRTGTLPM